MYVVAKAARQIPVAHPAQDRLVDLLKALRDLPDPQDLSSECIPGPVKLWRNLSAPTDTVLRVAVDIDEGANLEVFIARLIGARLANILWLALWSLNKALETEPPETSIVHKRQGQRLDETIPRSVAWIELAGAGLYQQCVDSALEDTQHALGGNWTGPRGLSKGRWDYWKQRFGEVSENEQPSQDTRVLAKKAKALMEYYAAKER